jgi:hypothetical protein
MSEEAKPKSQAAQRLGAFTTALSVVCILTAGLTSCARLGSPVADAAPVPTTATVLRAVDGDTVDVVDDNRGRLRIRVLGINTAEAPPGGYLDLASMLFSEPRGLLLEVPPFAWGSGGLHGGLALHLSHPRCGAPWPSSTCVARCPGQRSDRFGCNRFGDGR